MYDDDNHHPCAINMHYHAITIVGGGLQQKTFCHTGTNVSRDELGVSKDVGRLGSPEADLPDSCLATGRHHGSGARCDHCIVIRMILQKVFVTKG